MLLQKVANLALTPRTKQKPLDALLALINAMPDATVAQADALVVLYRHFSTKQSKAVPKTPFDWVKKAAATNDIRFYLHYPRRFANGDLVATDGGRLHLVRNAGHAARDAAYDLNDVEVNAETAGKFPDYPRVIPRHADALATCRSIGELGVTAYVGGGCKPGEVMRVEYLGVVVHVKTRYYHDAVCGFAMVNPVVRLYSDKITLELDDRLAVVMGRRI